ncbi:alpha/beta fold hydrolase [Aquimarina macrocephali]|uniref:alpha/beta fold hydrolase n=1 Tax=Aquimarina macrocephali TaxID=666563 RepID=UPI0004639E46|nr:alpha/beta hydrolase [Aquimarina macrocephali]
MNLKKTLNILQKISPRLTAQIAFNFISKPKNRKIRAFEKSILEIAIETIIRFKKFNIKTYTWGNGNKKALLIHGWGGRASNFGAIIPELTKNGYKVISFDGPCHGASTKKKTSFFEMSDLVKLFLEKDKYDLIITHSMGSVLAFTAMSSLKYKINQMIILTTPSRFLEFIGLAVVQFGLTTETTKLLINKIKKTTTKYDPVTFKVSTVIKDIEMKDVTFIHDKYDKIIPVEKTKSVSSLFKNSKFIEIEGTGHFKMLWSKKVIKIIEQQILSYNTQKM